MSAATPPESSGAEMPLLGHLEELRARLIRCVLAMLVGFVACFAFAEKILGILLRPLTNILPPESKIQALGVAEKFLVSMKAAFVAGLFLVSPVIFYQIWKFIAPGLYEDERRLAVPVALFTALCFVSGACFGYFVVFPFGFRFLVGYGVEVATLMPVLSEYFSLCLKLLLAFGLIFEMPVFIFFLARFGIVDAKWLRKQRRWAIVVIFVVAAILTPPDVVSQVLMAVPMVLLYEISIWVAHFFGKKKTPEGESAPPAPVGGEPDRAAPDVPVPAEAAAQSGDAPASDAPSQPEPPASGDAPVESEAPAQSQSDVPAPADGPATPETPVTPGEPSEPDAPSAPAAPGTDKPETPGNGGKPAA